MVDELLTAYFTHVHVSIRLRLLSTETNYPERMASNIQARLHTLQRLSSIIMLDAGDICVCITTFDCQWVRC